MYIPTTKEELLKLGWNELDVILISGDTYIDTPYNGSAVVGKVLIENGYKVGIIAQPDINSDKDIKRLGEPKLFWGVSGGCVDSMVANYTATKKRRKSDDFTPGGENNRRPDRAVIKYSNLIRQYFKNTVPISLGGIESSLRRVTHYDYWSNSLRKSVLFDAKADILLYGMSEKTIVKLADTLKDGKDYSDLRGLCYISKEKKEQYIQLPSFEDCKKDKLQFIEMFHHFYKNNDPITAKGLCQLQDTRYLIQNPPEFYLGSSELDKVYDIEYHRDVHPYYKKQGNIKALETIKFSVTTHQGCYGECNFCAIAVHQGRTIRQRSERSIIQEIKGFTKDPRFKGNISDVGGATANMYGYECQKKLTKGSCEDKRCLTPTRCGAMKVDHKPQIDLLEKIRKMEKVKKVFIASGLRYDLINDDKKNGEHYLKELVNHHVSGQLKIAPEHTQEKILSFMGKPKKEALTRFKTRFDSMNKKANKKQFLTYYLIAAHPGCSENDMENLKKYTSANLKINPEQVQIFTPTPSTYSTLMYYTEMDPFTMEKIFVEKDINRKQKQKDLINRQENYKKPFRQRRNNRR
ncbi:MAG: YgiQ family radical SAM protein [Campylobacterales bacterium]|nr:YgiQ family radical SAM protein [Campylobacterales bacterium]